MRVLLASDWMESALENLKLLKEGRIGWQQADVSVVPFSTRKLPGVIYDYDVVIVDQSHETVLHYSYGKARFYDALKDNLVQLSNEVSRALSQGRVIICLAGRQPGDVEDMPRYEWVKKGGILLTPSQGERIELTRHGARAGVKEYLTRVGNYAGECSAAVVPLPLPLAEKHAPRHLSLVQIKDTEYAVAMEASYPAGGFMVVVPPPKKYDLSTFEDLIKLGIFYHEKSQRRVVVGEEPDWVEQFKTEKHRSIPTEIQKLEERLQHQNTITYLLWGAGDELVEGVRITLRDLEVYVKKTERGANVDLEPENEIEEIKLFFEVTGSKEPVKKDSNKVAQAMEFIRDHADDASAKLVVVANAYNHLSLGERAGKPDFTEPVVRLLEPHGVLMMTTAQLYLLWKEVQERKKKAEDIRELLTSATGVLQVS